MRVLLINGSPHEKGCTYTALSHVEKALHQQDIDTKIYWIGNKAIHGCMDCGKCTELKKRTINDTVNEFREMAKEYDGYVFGTPVYFAGMNASLKAFMDRLFFSDMWGRNQTFTRKPAAAVMTARRGGATATYDQINKYFGLNQMPIVSSVYWNFAYGMKPEQIEADQEGLFTLETLGNNMAWLLKCINAGAMQEIKESA